MTHRHGFGKNNLPPTGRVDTFPKKDAWIVWTTNKEGLINDFVVYFRLASDEYHIMKVANYVDSNCKTSYKDIGNCNSNWEEFTLSDLLLKFFLQYGFEDEQVAICAMEQLMFIEEFKEPLKPMISNILSNKGLELYYEFARE